MDKKEYDAGQKELIYKPEPFWNDNRYFMKYLELVFRFLFGSANF